MRLLSQDFLDQCPVEHGFRLRGMDMTRIEVFVDAAFAFAVTMLVISFDSIPSDFEEMMTAVKGIPAFIAAVAQLVWIWYEHTKWSRRYGLENAVTVVLSAALLIVVLVYIYPLRVMLAGMFHWFSSGYLPSGFDLQSVAELSGMFVFMGAGFTALCLIFVLMYRYAGRLRDTLRLSGYERFETRTVELIWLGSAGVGLSSVILALALPDRVVPFAGFVFFALGIWIPYIRVTREKFQKAHFPVHE